MCCSVLHERHEKESRCVAACCSVLREQDIRHTPCNESSLQHQNCQHTATEKECTAECCSVLLRTTDPILSYIFRDRRLDVISAALDIINSVALFTHHESISRVKRNFSSLVPSHITTPARIAHVIRRFFTLRVCVHSVRSNCNVGYRVASISRLLKIIGLFCRI